MSDILEASIGPIAPFTIENKPVVQYTPAANNAGCILTFIDSSTKLEAFVIYSPVYMLHSRELADQLKLASDISGTLKVKEPFGETNVAGCFAAGDCASPVKTIPQAILSGVNAAEGAASHVQSRKYGHRCLGDFLREKESGKSHMYFPFNPISIQQVKKDEEGEAGEAQPASSSEPVKSEPMEGIESAASEEGNERAQNEDGPEDGA